MSNAVSARIDQLNMPLLRSSEKHGRRLDKTSQARKVRDEPSLAWSPYDGDPLALVDRLAEHVAGAFVPEGKTKAQHMILKMPDSVPVATVEDAERAMTLGVEFVQETFGGNAVFAARIDRDEESLNNVDVFFAPRYDKVTKRATRPAISMTRHLKQLAERRGREAEGGGARGGMIAQGRALQDEFADWLKARGFEAERGVTKTTRGSDNLTPEEYGAKKDREAAEAALAEAQRLREAADLRNTQLNDREREVQKGEAHVRRETGRLAAKAIAVQQDRASADAAIEAARQRDEALDSREEKIGERETSVGERETRVGELETSVGQQADRLSTLIERLEPLLTIVQRAHDRLATAPEQIRRWLDPDRQVDTALRKTSPLLAHARAAARSLMRGPKPPEQTSADDDLDLATLAAARDGGSGRGS